QQRVADRENWCRVDDHSAKVIRCFRDQPGKLRSAQQFRRIRSALAAGQEIKLAARRGNCRTRAAAPSENVHFARGNSANGLLQCHRANQVIDNPGSIRLEVDLAVSWLMDLSKNLVKTWAA